MIKDRENFVDFVLKTNGFVTYGDNNKGRTFESGDIDNGSSIFIQNVLFVEDLKYTLLSISQLCDKSHKLYIWSLIYL